MEKYRMPEETRPLDEIVGTKYTYPPPGRDPFGDVCLKCGKTTYLCKIPNSDMEDYFCPDCDGLSEEDKKSMDKDKKAAIVESAKRIAGGV